MIRPPFFWVKFLPVFKVMLKTHIIWGTLDNRTGRTCYNLGAFMASI